MLFLMSWEQIFIYRVPFEEEEEIIDIIPLKKKVKQEVCTPSRLENESHFVLDQHA
jgi:hypothetical protein